MSIPNQVTRQSYISAIALSAIITALLTFALTYFGMRRLDGAQVVSTQPTAPPIQATAPTEKPKPVREKTPLDDYADANGYKYVGDDVVFVTQGVYGGDLSERAILKGKVRNVSTTPHKNVFVLWMFVGSDRNPFKVGAKSGYQTSVFTDHIDYLDSKAEADFKISIDLNDNVYSDPAKAIRKAINNNNKYVGIFEK